MWDLFILIATLLGLLRIGKLLGMDRVDLICTAVLTTGVWALCIMAFGPR